MLTKSTIPTMYKEYLSKCSEYTTTTSKRTKTILATVISRPQKKCLPKTLLVSKKVSSVHLSNKELGLQSKRLVRCSEDPLWGRIQEQAEG